MRSSAVHPVPFRSPSATVPSPRGSKGDAGSYANAENGTRIYFESFSPEGDSDRPTGRRPKAEPAGWERTRPKVSAGYRIAVRDPLRIGVFLAAATELACATLVHTSAGSGGARDIPASRGVVAASLLASAGQPAWRVPALASASLHHLVRAGRLRRLADLVWAAALGALLREARRAERWEA
jgi:hypothetical protein